MAAHYGARNPNPPPSPGKGRPLGVPNKIGAQVKENILAVFERLGATDAMVKWARRNKTEFYRFYARLAPTYMIATVDIRDASELTDGELARIIARAGSAGTAGEAAGSEVPDSIH